MLLRYLQKEYIILIFIIFLAGSIFYYSGFQDITSISGAVTFEQACMADNTIFKVYNSISSGYNSHVSLWNSLNPAFDIKVCSTELVNHNACGSNPDSDSKQVVFWLFDSDNSHVSQNNRPDVGPGTVYDVPVCYNNKYCVYASQSDCDDVGLSDFECVASMSDVYNAHVGDCDEYNIKICCGNRDPDLVCTLYDTANWNVPSAVVGQSIPSMIVDGSESCSGERVIFEVFENDISTGEDSSDDPVLINPPRSTFVFVSDEFENYATVTTNWIAEWQEDCLLGLCNPPEYYFKASLQRNPSNFVISETIPVYQSVQGGVCGDAITQCLNSQNFCEECDDGNTDSNDACKTNCLLNVCGDGLLYNGIEECDDGNTIDNDWCNNACFFNMCFTNNHFWAYRNDTKINANFPNPILNGTDVEFFIQYTQKCITTLTIDRLEIREYDGAVDDSDIANVSYNVINVSDVTKKLGPDAIFRYNWTALFDLSEIGPNLELGSDDGNAEYYIVINFTNVYPTYTEYLQASYALDYPQRLVVLDPNVQSAIFYT